MTYNLLILLKLKIYSWKMEKLKFALTKFEGEEEPAVFKVE